MRKVAEKWLVGLIVRHWNRTTIRSHHGVAQTIDSSFSEAAAIGGRTDQSLSAGSSRDVAAEQVPGTRTEANKQKTPQVYNSLQAPPRPHTGPQASCRAVVISAGRLQRGDLTTRRELRCLRPLSHSESSCKGRTSRPSSEEGGQSLDGKPAWWPGSGGATHHVVLGPAAGHCTLRGPGAEVAVCGLYDRLRHAEWGAGRAVTVLSMGWSPWQHTASKAAPEDVVPRGDQRNMWGPSWYTAPWLPFLLMLPGRGRPLTRFGPPMGSS